MIPTYSRAGLIYFTQITVAIGQSARLSLVKSVFVYIAQYHKFASRGFTVCTVYNTLCPQTLDTNKEKLPTKSGSNRGGIPLPGRTNRK